VSSETVSCEKLARFQRSLHTISSLHIGQTILELAAAAAWAVACSSRATRAVMSSFSVDMGVLEVCELKDIELFEGDRAPEGRNCDLTGAGGARLLPLPSTLPPPKLLRAAMILTSPETCTSRDRVLGCKGLDGAASVRVLPSGNVNGNRRGLKLF